MSNESASNLHFGVELKKALISRNPVFCPSLLPVCPPPALSSPSLLCEPEERTNVVLLSSWFWWQTGNKEVWNPKLARKHRRFQLGSGSADVSGGKSVQLSWVMESGQEAGLTTEFKWKETPPHPLSLQGEGVWGCQKRRDEDLTERKGGEGQRRNCRQEMSFLFGARNSVVSFSFVLWTAFWIGKLELSLLLLVKKQH